MIWSHINYLKTWPYKWWDVLWRRGDFACIALVCLWCVCIWNLMCSWNLNKAQIMIADGTSDMAWPGLEWKSKLGVRVFLQSKNVWRNYCVGSRQPLSTRTANSFERRHIHWVWVPQRTAFSFYASIFGLWRPNKYPRISSQNIQIRIRANFRVDRPRITWAGRVAVILLLLRQEQVKAFGCIGEKENLWVRHICNRKTLSNNLGCMALTSLWVPGVTAARVPCVPFSPKSGHIGKNSSWGNLKNACTGGWVSRDAWVEAGHRDGERRNSPRCVLPSRFFSSVD